MMHNAPIDIIREFSIDRYDVSIYGPSNHEEGRITLDIMRATDDERRKFVNSGIATGWSFDTPESAELWARHELKTIIRETK